MCGYNSCLNTYRAGLAFVGCLNVLAFWLIGLDDIGLDDGLGTTLKTTVRETIKYGYAKTVMTAYLSNSV